MNKNSFYITTTLPYVNAPLHMGHALEFVRADIIARYKKLQGFDVEIYEVPGHDLDMIRQALSAPSIRPKIIILKTTKGSGVSFMENKMEWHYLPLNSDQYQQAISEVAGG